MSGKLTVAGLALALLGVLAPGAGAATLTVSPTYGPPGAKVTATAAGFTADDSLTFKVGGKEVGDDAANASGGGSAKFRIPTDVNDDVVTIIVRSESTRKAARASFTVRVNSLQLGFDAGHNNVNRYEKGLGRDVAGDIEPLWFGASGSNFDRSSPVKSGATIYAMRTNGAVAALNSTTGSTFAWPGPFGNAVSLSTPAVSSGGTLLYTADQDGTVRALNIGAKSLAWTGTTDGAISGALTVTSSNVYAGTEGGSVYAFPLACSATCAPQWIGQVGSPVRGGVAVANGRVYAAGHDGGLRAFNVGCNTGGGTCAPVDSWSPAIVDYPEGQVVAAGGRVAFVTEKRVAVFNAYCLTCGVLWTGEATPQSGTNSRSNPIMAGGRLFARVHGTLLAYDIACASDGTVCSPLWQAQVGATGGIAYANGVVWVAAARRLLGFRADCRTDGATCSPLASAGTPNTLNWETTPLVADGRIYFGVGGTIAAYGVPD